MTLIHKPVWMHFKWIYSIILSDFQTLEGLGIPLVHDNASLMWSEWIGSSKMTKALMPLTGPRSPNPSPIEHLGDVMHGCIQRCQVPPRTAQELTDAQGSDIFGSAWKQNTLLSHIMSWRDKIHASWISLRFQFFTGTFSVNLNPDLNGPMILVSIDHIIHQDLTCDLSVPSMFWAVYISAQPTWRCMCLQTLSY